MESRPRRRRLSSSEKLRFHAREQALRDLQEAYSAPNLNRNVNEAKDFLGSIIKEIGAKEGIEHEVLISSWNKIAGDFVAKHAEPCALKRGILTLRVLQPSMRFHLEELKGKLLKNLQTELGKNVVKQVRFTIG